MTAEAKTQIIDGLTVSSTPLNPFRALDLVPELAGLMDGASMDNDVGMFVSLARNLGGGRLRTLLPQILAGTKLTITQNGTPIPLQLNTVEAIDMAFDGRMGSFAAVVVFALEVSFRDFFVGFVQAAKRTRTPSP